LVDEQHITLADEVPIIPLYSPHLDIIYRKAILIPGTIPLKVLEAASRKPGISSCSSSVYLPI
jgi:hypothetical protein